MDDKMYGKKVLAKHTTYYDNNYIDVVICEGENDYYDIHVIHPSYKDDENNTLELQEPKDCVILDEISNPVQMECYAIEKGMWHKFYGKNDKSYNFSISFESDEG